MPEVTGEQVVSARELLNWSQADLAAHAGLSADAVQIVERGGGVQALEDVLGIIVRTLQAHGVRFENNNVSLAADVDTVSPEQLNAQNDT